MREDVENIALHLLGTPNKALSSKRELRWGEHGRVVLFLQARKWRDWRDDEGGDALDLVEREKSLDRAAAITWLADEWFAGTAAPIDHAAREQQARRDQIDQARQTRFKIGLAADIWNASLQFAGSPAEDYLLRTRFPGWRLPPALYRCGALRWNADERIDGSDGAMVALMTDPVSGKSSGIHRTYLDGDRNRISRKMLGNWGCVRLWRDDEVTGGLSIGEGIESTIAGVLLTDRAPAWAALDASGVKAFPVLTGIECLSLFVDNDASQTGQRAAETCADRWMAAGREAVLFEPTATGDDFNKILQRRVA